MSQSFKIAPDLLDAKSQLASDHEWLWKITIRLRQSDEIIERTALLPGVQKATRPTA